MSPALGCPSPDRLRALSVGTLEDEHEIAVVAEHAAGCSACQEIVDGAGQRDALISAFRRPANGEGTITVDYRELFVRLSRRAAERNECDVLATPCRFGEYDVAAELGRGGWGVVYLARHEDFGDIALKVLHPHLSDDAEAAERFQGEIKSLYRLNSPHVVRPLAHGELDGRLFLAMELVEGRTFAELTHETEPLELTEVCRLVSQAAAALQHLHERGLVHRDIKLTNLMLADNGATGRGRAGAGAAGGGTVKLLDLGIAQLPEEMRTTGDRTTTGSVFGAPPFMAPEALRDTKSVDIRADIYSLGGVLAELVRVSREHQQNRRRSLRRVHSIESKMRSYDPSSRYATPAEVIAALQPLSRRSLLRQQRFWLAAAAMLTAALAIGAGGFAAGWFGHAGSAQRGQSDAELARSDPKFRLFHLETFDASPLHENHWRIQLPTDIKAGDPPQVAIAGDATLTNRGWLVNVNRFPAGLKLRFRWRWMEPDEDTWADALTVALRTSGEHRPKWSNDALDGVLITFDGSADKLPIAVVNMRDGARTLLASFAVPEIRALKWYEIILEDHDGRISIWFGDPPEFVGQVEIPDDSLHHHFALFNREGVGGKTHRSIIDDLVIDVPVK